MFNDYEFDTEISKGQPILMHDKTIERTTGGKRPSSLGEEYFGLGYDKRYPRFQDTGMKMGRLVLEHVLSDPLANPFYSVPSSQAAPIFNGMVAEFGKPVTTPSSIC